MRKSTVYKPMLLPMLLAVIPWFCSAQDMALAVMGSSGGTAVSSGFSLSWTVGEVNIQSTAQATDYLGAGFQQARQRNTTVGAFQPYLPLVDLEVFPNPAGELLTVKSNTLGLTLRLFDLWGRQVLADANLNGTEQLPLTLLPAGTYILTVFDQSGRLAGLTKVQHTDF